jgi:hypothetical protein
MNDDGLDARLRPFLKRAGSALQIGGTTAPA